MADLQGMDQSNRIHSGGVAGQPKVAEDQQLISDLHQRGKHAQEQAGYHQQQLMMWNRITESCTRALDALEMQTETDYDQAEAPSPSRFH